MKHKHIHTHITATPFDNPHVKRIIDKEIGHQSTLRQRTVELVDPFARRCFSTQRPQGLNCTTNDLDPTMPTDFHMEANDFCELMHAEGKQFDLILWDPPYNLSQLKRQYDGIGKKLELWQTLQPFTRAKDAIIQCLRPGGSIISLGFNSRGFGERRNMERMAVYNIEPAGTEYRYNIQICVERRLQQQLVHVESKHASDTDT